MHAKMTTDKKIVMVIFKPTYLKMIFFKTSNKDTKQNFTID